MSTDIIEKIDKKINEKSILKHPFYQSWASGKLTNGTMQEYARQYYMHVAAFPQYLSAIHSKIDDGNDRLLILQNLMDEEHGPKNHPELWIKFAEATGVKRTDINCTPNPETSAFINNFKFITSQKTAVEGIAAMYAYESQIPKVSEEKIAGLVKFYGVTSESGLEYFKVHMQADIEHSEAERNLIRKYAKDPETQKRVLEAVKQTLDAYWLMLTGIQNMCMKNA